MPNKVPGKGKETGGGGHWLLGSPFLRNHPLRVPYGQASIFWGTNPKGINPASDLIEAKHVDQVVNTSMHAKTAGGDHKKRGCSSTSGSTGTTIPAVPTVVPGKSRYSPRSVNGDRV